MKKNLFIFSLVFSLFLLENLFAHEFQVGNININHPYVRFAVSTGPAAGYMTIINTGEENDKLIKIESPIATNSEFHMTNIYNSQATMERVDFIELPAQKARSLKPGGYHIMFMNLNTELKVGKNIDAKLFFEKNGEIEIDFEVENFSENLEHTSH
tara:strand:+ start:1396 stop:1863 length:468 start_codon:yes stop_codon:yes gene_type:complete